MTTWNRSHSAENRTFNTHSVAKYQRDPLDTMKKYQNNSDKVKKVRWSQIVQIHENVSG